MNKELARALVALYTHLIATCSTGLEAVEDWADSWCRRYARMLRHGLRAFTRISVSVLGIVIVCGYFSKSPYKYDLATTLQFRLFPMPIAFFLWARLVQTKGKFGFRISPLFAALSLAGFVAGIVLINTSKKYPPFATIAFVFGLSMGYFVFTPFSNCLSRAISNPRATFVALLCAVPGIAYYSILYSPAGGKLLLWTSEAVSFIVLETVESAEVIRYRYPRYDVLKPLTLVKSPHFDLLVAPLCSGLEGACIIVFLLSALLLFDWRMFRRRALSLLYALALIYFFVINVLRIVLLFLLGYWVYSPGAGYLARSMQDRPVDLIHSYAGALLYPFSFALFAVWLYWSTGRSNRRRSRSIL